MDRDQCLLRIAGGMGCDLVTGTSEFTARRGRIFKLISNVDDSRILNMTEEHPVPALVVKPAVVITGRSYMSIRRVDIVTLTGTGGTANITCNAVTKLATFSDSLTKTASDFVTAWAADYLTAGVIVTSDGAVLMFTAVEAGTNFTGNTSIANASGDLTGSIGNEVSNSVVAINKGVEIIADYPLTKFTPAKGSFWVYYNHE